MRFHSFLFILLISLTYLGCSKDSSNEEYQPIVKCSILKPDESIDSVFLVSHSDIEQYLIRQQIANGKRCVNLLQIDYLGFPVGYMVEYESSWEILSADRRGPIILAECDEKNHEFNSFPDAAQDWLIALYQDIADRWARKEPLNTENEEEIQSYEFWDTISKPNPLDTKANPNSPLYTWELISTDISSEEYEEIAHLTTTLWHQNPPYNAACPLVSSFGVDRAVAGCGPVAAAQYLYYLHYYWGIPLLAPSYVYSNDVLPSQTIYSTGPNSSGIWSYMNNESTTSNKAYYLIADIGKRNDTQYGADSSPSYFYKTINALGDYGIFGHHAPYQKDTVISYLDRSLPVLMRAGSSDGGHAFLVDGFVRYRTRYVDTYLVQCLDPISNVPIMEPWTEQIVYHSAPYIHLLKMNWGWGSGTWHNTRYALSGTWNASGISFDRNFRMLCNVTTYE